MNVSWLECQFHYPLGDCYIAEHWMGGCVETIHIHTHHGVKYSGMCHAGH